MILFLRFVLSLSFDWEDISNTQGRVSPHFQTPRSSSKYAAACRIFNSLLVVLKCDETRSFVIGILCIAHRSTSSVIYYWTDARQHGISFRFLHSVNEVWILIKQLYFNVQRGRENELDLVRNLEKKSQ